MDEQSTHDEGEQETDTGLDEATDTTATDTGEQATESLDEQGQDALDKKKEDESKAKAEREKQVDTWAKNIQDGTKKLEDLPVNLAWLKPLVEAKLGKKAPEVPDLEEVVEKAVTKREQAKQFVILEDDWKQLEGEDKTKVKEKYQLFRTKGLAKLDALEAAYAAANISQPHERENDEVRQAARLRTPGRYKAPSKNANPAQIETEAGYAEVVKNMSPEQRLEYLKSLKKGR